MAIRTYTPQNKIIHQIKVDFVRRDISQIIHVVQGDQYLPIVEVKLYKNGVSFDISELEPTDINVRCKNAYSQVLGLGPNGTSLYFEISKEMSKYAGSALTVIEVKSGDEIVNSSPFFLDIDRNPIWENEYVPDSGSGISLVANYKTEPVTAMNVLDVQNYVLGDDNI